LKIITIIIQIEHTKYTKLKCIYELEMTNNEMHFVMHSP